MITAYTPGTKVRIGVLGSTRGTDLQPIIDAVEGGALPAEIACVISDRKHAYILERAQLHGLPGHFISPFFGAKGTRKRREREEYDQEITALLSVYGVDIILLIGYMRILSPYFCRSWESRVVNVHPSLLPEFAGGMDEAVHQAVLDAQREESGCTVHLVTDDLDEGPIIVQKRCRVYQQDSAETLKERVQQLEGQALLEAVMMFHANGTFTPDITLKRNRDKQE